MKELPQVGERRQIAVNRLSPEYWRVNIDNPPHRATLTADREYCGALEPASATPSRKKDRRHVTTIKEIIIQKLQGGCLCGAVRYRSDAASYTVQIKEAR